MRARQGLDARLAGLREAVDALSHVPAEMLGTTAPLERAREVLGNVGRRRELSGDHTVVALAGATGSGKSSLLNALAGVDAATVGARRPTTAHPLAVLWTGTEVDPVAARPLLEWLEVGRTHEVPAGTGGWVDPDAVAGLVLLDLPDIDSVQVEHRRRAERLARTVDALVWVLDPQKYADAVVHTEFLRPMARYAEVTVVVLNQVDTLAEADRPAVLADLRERLVEDGLRDATVLTTSARTGEGVDRVREVIADLVRRRQAAQARLAADVATVAEALDDAYHADVPRELPAPTERTLVTALASAAGVDRVAEAVAGSYRYRAGRRTGWPLLRWLGRFRADPLRRLGLGRAGPAGPVDPDAPVTTITSVPAASPVERAQVHTALRSLGDVAAGGSRDPWRSYLRAGATSRAATVPDELDQAVLRTRLDDRDGRWFGLVGVLQWLVFAVFAAGVLWLGVYAVLGYLRIEIGWVPQVGPVPADPPLPALPAIPWPTVLLVGGAVLGLLVALLSRAAAALGARRRAARTRTALRRSITETARTGVLAEVAARAATAREFADGVRAARG